MSISGAPVLQTALLAPSTAERMTSAFAGVVTGEDGALDAVRGEEGGHVSDRNEVARRDKRE